MKTIASLMLTLAVACTACTKDPDNGGDNGGNGGGNGGGSSPTTEGVYLGIIGFNQELYTKEIKLLNSSTSSVFTNFIDGLTPGMGTGLFYADYTALKKLKSFAEPPKLKNVALVTFTDGLDNVSTATSQTDPENYGSISAYREALHNMIMNDKVHGKSITAYSIGLKGNDVTDDQAFSLTLQKLASSSNNVFEVSNMTEALQRFKEIAEALYSVTTTVSLAVDVPGGYDDGQLIRFTFDNVNSATSSSKYIEATYKRTSNGRNLENVSYHGFAQGATTLSSVSQGVYYRFKFDNFSYTSGDPVTQTDMDRIKLWKQTSNGNWDKETEFSPGSSSNVTEDKSSALIMLVLDCTTSLGSDFSKMQSGAKSFIETLISSNGGGNSGGGGNGGGTDQYYQVSVSSTAGGTASGGGSFLEGSTCTVTAMPNTNYTFANWTENGSVVSSLQTYSFTVTGNRSLVANFTYNGGSGGGSNAPTGAINGKFTINASGDKVYFSQGNLQYQASTQKWQFAANQYDCIGNNSSISSSYSGWIDLFGWGTSGWNSGANCYQPWSTSTTNSDYYPGGSYTNNLTGSYANADWGVYNAVSNGGNQAGLWRTLTGGSSGEWYYVFNTRNTSSGIRYAKAQVAGVNGVILLPDDWSASTYSLTNTNTSGASFSSNTVSASQWTTLENAGAVFLPAAGYRYGTSVYNVGSYGNYWSSSYNDSDSAYYVYFFGSFLYAGNDYSRCDGFSVRLVRACQ